MADRLVVDCSTGEEEARPLTPEEEAEAVELSEKAEDERRDESARTTIATTLDSRLADALAALRNFVDSPKPSTAAAQASAAYDAAKLLSRLMVALVRHRLGRYDATD